MSGRVKLGALISAFVIVAIAVIGVTISGYSPERSQVKSEEMKESSVIQPVDETGQVKTETATFALG
jgi:hypothetical protein